MEGVLKSAVFGVACSLVAVYEGYHCVPTAEGVGRATGRAIRLSIVAVVIINLVLSLIFWGGGDTVSLTG